VLGPVAQARFSNKGLGYGVNCTGKLAAKEDITNPSRGRETGNVKLRPNFLPSSGRSLWMADHLPEWGLGCMKNKGVDWRPSCYGV